MDSCAEIKVECPVLGNLQREQVKGRDKIKFKKTTITTKKRNRILNIIVGQWGGELRGSRLEAWKKSHKSKVAITFICTPTNQETVSVSYTHLTLPTRSTV